MPATPVARHAWSTARGSLPLGRPIVAGILNLTPDSFWPGGRFLHHEAAIRHAAAMIDAGADVIDVGGESTRPGARTVPAAVEIARTASVIAALARRFPDTPLSIDTVKADVARAALDAGAAIINDVSGLRLDPDLGPVAAQAGAGLVLMHSRGTVESMAGYELATYDADPVAAVAAELDAAVGRARAAGVRDDAIVLDPGLGFAKRTAHSAAVLRGLGRIAALGFPVMVGPSRKRFVGELAGGLDAADRLEGTLAVCVVALLAGAQMFRVHDVGPARRALDVAHRIRPEP